MGLLWLLVSVYHSDEVVLKLEYGRHAELLAHRDLGVSCLLDDDITSFPWILIFKDVAFLFHGYMAKIKFKVMN